MKKLIFIIGLSFLFIGCSKRYIYEVLEDYNLNGSTIIREQFSFIIPDDTGLKGGWKKRWNGNNPEIIKLQHNIGRYDEKYSLRIVSRSSENYSYKGTHNSSPFGFGGSKISYEVKGGTKEIDLQRLEAIKNKDEEYLRVNFLEGGYWKAHGIVSVNFSNVNQYPAIEVMSKKEITKNETKYTKTYYIYTYTKTEKLKEYRMEISANIDKSEEKYSFEDMLKRSQRSLDSLKLTDEDIRKTGYYAEHSY